MAGSRHAPSKPSPARPDSGSPHATQAIQVTRSPRPITTNSKKTDGKRRQRREIVYAICTLPAQDALPAELAAWIRGHWSVDIRSSDCTYE